MVRIVQGNAYKMRDFDIRNLNAVNVENGSVKFTFSNIMPLETSGEFHVTCDCTADGVEFVNMFDLKRLTSVSAVKKGIPTDVTFGFNDGVKFTLTGAFNIGFGGTGPTGLYSILQEAGFSGTKGVFSTDITEFYLERVLK